MKAPDFLCVGAQKAGTTWLHENLRIQPEIWLPPVKELHFLDHRPPSMRKRVLGRTSFHRLARQNARDSLKRWASADAPWTQFSEAFHIAFAPRNWDWYEAIFPDDQHKICGEICPGYARLSADVVAELARRNPDIRIIYLLRDPIDRAWSSVAMHFRKGGDDLIGNHAGVEVMKRLKSPKSFPHCTYQINIETWLQHVPREQMYFGFFERIREEPREYLADILRFLGVSGEVASQESSVRINSGRGEKIDPDFESQLANLFLNEARWLNDTFHNRFTETWLRHAQTAGTRSLAS